MPAAFERCCKAGGRVRTITGPRPAKGALPALSAGEYCPICLLGKGKAVRVYAGEVHTRASSRSSGKSHLAEAIHRE